MRDEQGRRTVGLDRLRRRGRELRGPAPFLFVPVPDALVGEVTYAARLASNGWGCVPVAARIGATDFTTSLFPRGETYMLPVKVAAQRAEQIGLGDVVSVAMRTEPR